MTTDTIKSSLNEFLTHAYGDRSLGDDEDIFALGFGNSLFAMQLVEFVEREFDILLEDEDLDMEHFTTIAAMARLVERKRALSRR